MYMSRHEEEYEMILSPMCFQKDCNKTKVYNEEGEPVGKEQMEKHQLQITQTQGPMSVPLVTSLIV